MHEEVIEGFRLSPQQRRLWRQQSADAAGAYVAQAALLVEGALRPGLLRAAVGEVVARHEILRTGYLTPPEMSAALQVIGEPRLDWREDARAWPSDPDEQQSELASLLAEARREPFDLARGPVLRAHLFELDGGHHLLIYTLPALAADTRTLETLSDEIAGAYDALVRGEAREGEPLQYADLSEWQNELLEAEEGSPGREFWRRHATGATRPLRLPADEPDAEADARGPRLVRAPLDARLTARLRALAESRGCTVRAVLLAGWQTLLWRLSGEPEASCRVLFDGRQYAEMENALGLCARYLPVGARLGTELQFGELVADVEARLGEAARYQEYFIEEEAAPREAGSGGLSVGFEFRRWPPARRAAGLAYTFLALSSRFERLDLGLSCAETEDSISVELHYDPRALRAGAAERLARSLHALLQGAAEGPHLPLGRLNILDEAERARLLYDFNRTAADVADDLCVHRLFERQAGQTPEATAVVFKDARLTYRELDERAERLARRLRARGVAPEAAVGLCAERSVEMVVGILAVLKAGGAYLPLDPSYPRERLGFMLEDTRVPVLLAERRLLPNLPAHAAQVVCFDEEADEAESEPLAPAREPAPDNAAYVIYTSGSTGKPKGVVVTHRNLAHSTAARALYYRSPVESFLLTSSFAFDSSVAGIFWTLCHGGALVLPEEDGHRDVARLAELLCAHRVSHMLTLPSVYALLLEHAQAERLDLTATFIVAGDACPPELVERHREAAPRAGLFNEYGPTECTVWSTVHDCLAPGRAGATVPIGRPIANARVYLLGGGGEPAPAGAPGELYIGGAGLARGYLDRPALTAERFVPDPFSPEPGARLYRTGDVARHLGGGAIEFLGRADSQVKVRGFRVELAEVESALARHEKVREAVVTVVAAPGDDRRLAAYLVPSNGGPVDPAGMRDFLARSLPAYMIPAHFVTLDALPLTTSGKLDRRRLPPPAEGAAQASAAFVAPRTPVERELAGMWCELLGLEGVGVNDNFFELGGHSLMLMQLALRINESFGVELPLSALFDARSIAEMTNAISAAQMEREDPAELALLLEELDALSPEELQALLDAENDLGP